MKGKTKQQRSLCASNAAHARLEKLNSDKYAKTHRDEYQSKAMYHGACGIRQKKAGRVFTRAAREKVYTDVILTFW